MPIFYDYEVIKHDWLGVFIDSDNRTETVIINDRQRMIDFYEKNKNRIWVGFNSTHYDVYILKAIVCGFDPKKVNDYIIIDGKSGWSFSNTFRQVSVNNFDVFTGYNGLKTLEAFMGHDIRESGVSFDIDRKLTQDELNEMVHYCRNDVQETIQVFLHRYEEFTSQIELIRMYNLPMINIGKSKPQLSAHILGAKKRANANADEFDFSIPETIEISKYKHIVDWYSNPDNRDYDKSLEVDVCGVPHVFAWGGLHGAVPMYRGRGIFMHIDVNSYYPAIMLEYGHLSRSVPSDKMFRQIRDLRIQYKKAHDKRANPLKIVINSTYGAMKDKTNPLYDPRQANNVCITGQLLLLDLLEHLDGHCDIIQSNTDGLIVKIPSEDKIDEVKSICKEWEARTGMGLGYDMFDKIYQADVNNYLIANGDEYESKGCVKKPEILDNDLPIVRNAVIEYMLHGTMPNVTINQCNDLMQLQQVVKVSKNYDFAVIMNNKGHEILNGKHFRVFASKDYNDGMIKRGKWSNTHKDLFGNIVIDKADKFASTSEHVFVDNTNVQGKPCPSKLDKSFYIGRAYDILARFGVNLQ